MAKKLLEYDTDTGEKKDLGFGKWISKEQQDAIRKRSAVAEAEKKQGNFIWFLFNYCELIFPDISCASITRLFYLSTFIEYNGDRLTLDDGYTFMGKRQVKQKLNLPDKSFTNFWNEMTEKNILSVNNEKHVVVNTMLFRKGNIDKRCNRDFTRIYCNCVRYIYENSTNVKDHAKLAYIFKIIPYVNRKTNIVCYNPEELDNKKIKPMTIGNFCDVIGYDRTHSARLFKSLAKFMVRGKHLFCYVSVDNFTLAGMFIIMNPEIYYGGAEHNDAKFLFEICDRKIDM